MLDITWENVYFFNVQMEPGGRDSYPPLATEKVRCQIQMANIWSQKPT